MKKIIIIIFGLLFINCTFLIASDFYGSKDLKFQKVRELTPEAILDPETHCSMPYVVRGAASNCPGMAFDFAHIGANYPDVIVMADIDTRYVKDLTNRLIIEKEYDGKYGNIDSIGRLLEVKNELMTSDLPIGLGGGMYLNMDETDENGSFLLHKEIACFPHMQYKGQVIKTVFFILGTKNNGSGMHAHPDSDSYLIEFQGPKVVTLASPSAAQMLGMEDKFSKVLNEQDCCISVADDDFSVGLNIIIPDLENHPEWTDVNLYQVVLEKGDLLYIPRKWFHDVYYACDECVGIPYFVKNCDDCESEVCNNNPVFQ